MNDALWIVTLHEWDKLSIQERTLLLYRTRNKCIKSYGGALQSLIAKYPTYIELENYSNFSTNITKKNKK